jgi:predicted dehydrogenase
MSGPLRIGVIGAGNFGQRHLQAYARQEGVRLVGVADRDEERARAAAARFGVERSFRDGAELIEACRPDGVSVVTPASWHRAPALAALAQGCAVLLEKPVACSSIELAEIQAAAAASSAFVMPAHILRFSAPYIELQARVRAGGIGRLLAISTLRDRGRAHEQLFPDVHLALMTLVHDIDLALWLTGSRALRVSANGRGGTPERPLLVWATVEAQDGSVWSLRGSWLLPEGAPQQDRLELYGSEGAALLDLRPTVMLAGVQVEGLDHELTPDAQPGAIDAEIDHFCACIRSGIAPSAVTLEEAAHGVEIAEAIIASLASGGAPVEPGAQRE